MDFLNKSFAQISDLFTSMTPGARVTAGLLLLLVVVSVAYLFNIQTAGPDTYLIGGNPFLPSDLPAVEAAFAAANLNSYEIEGNKIRVPRSQKSMYMAALADAQVLPPNFSDILEKAIESDSPFISGQQREQKIRIAKQKELALIIRSMRGIQNAAVLYDTEMMSGFRRKRVKTASVSVMPDGVNKIDDEQVRAIRQLVSAAYAGLKPDSVAVIDLRSGRTIQGNSGESENAGGGSYFSRKQQYERQWQKKLLDALAYVPGVTVVANVTLGTELRNQVGYTRADSKPITVYKNNTAGAIEKQGCDVAVANAPNALRLLAVAKTPYGNVSEASDRTQRFNSELAGQREILGLTPKKVEVSVGLPSSYFERVWLERNQIARGQDPKRPAKSKLDIIEKQEVEKITAFVARLLPDAAGVGDKSELVTVSAFQDIKPPAIESSGMTENVIAWLGEYWKTLGMLGLALFGLLTLRSITRSGFRKPLESEREPFAAATEVELPEPVVEEKVGDPLQKFGRPDATGSSLRDELAEVVNGDMEIAAGVLRDWIGNTGVKQ